MARRGCKYGKLKNPRGRRRCKLAPTKRGRGKKRYASKSSVATERARELELIARHKSTLGRYRRRRR